MLVVMCISFSACGSTIESPNSAPVADPKPSVSSENSNSGKTDSATSVKETTEYTIKDYTVVETDECAFRINDITDKKGNVQVSVYLENKTEDKTLMFAMEDCVVNGCAIDPFWAKTVAAGKKSNDSFTFSSSELETYGLTSVDELRFELRVYNYDDWLEDPVVKEVFSVYPTGKEADQVVYVKREDQSDDEIFVDNEELKVSAIGSGKGTFWAYYVSLYFENKTDEVLMFSWRDVSVNGYMCDPYFATTVPAHSCKYADVTFSTSAFEENNIETVEEVEFNLYVYDDENWLSDYLSETYSYTP